MFKVSKREPAWLEILPGVRVEFEPIGIKAVRAARRAAAAKLGIDPEDMEEAGDALTSELLRRGIRSWEGVGDDDGKPLPVNAETIEMAIANPDFLEAADRAYVVPWVSREREGNVSAPSPNGTGAAATPVDDTATSPATPRSKGDANRTRKRTRKAVRTSSTSPRQMTVPKSGTSSAVVDANSA